MKKYTVKKLADLAGVSVRTLHYYDEIGLLKPSYKTDAGYRLYVYDDLIRLQQILFFREIDFDLKTIKQLLDEKDFDVVSALEFQKKELLLRRKNMGQLIKTIDKTIINFNQKTMMNDNDIYKGLAPELKKYRQEAAERWGEEEVRASEDRLRKLGREGREKVFENGERITRELAVLMNEGKDAGCEEVQGLIDQWRVHLGNFRPVTDEYMRGLGEMYVADERFRAFYDKYAPGLADFKNRAIQIYCDNGMKIG